MTSITMASRCLDNLLPPGARRQREADYLCLTATSAIMYHSDGSTVNTTGVPAAPSLQEVSAVHMSSSPGGRALLPAILLALLELVGNSFLVFTLCVLSG